ncbi:MAG: ABC transporter ATP-binding protein [Halobacteriales archaeon]
MLEVDGIDVSYGDIEVLWDVSLSVGEGETVALLGANGAGKTTTLRAIFGLLTPTTGTITFRGEDITGSTPEEVVRRKIAYVPERRSLFPDMDVVENLELGAHVNDEDTAARRRRVFELFPRLEERRSQLAKTLSGGEQQMLAIGRGLMSDPTLLLLDEASLGLAPVLAEEVFEAIAAINEEGTTVLLVEQDLHSALGVADRGYVLSSGEIELSGTARELQQNERVSASYLGA